MFRRLSLLIMVCLLAAASVARATTVIPPTFDQLVAEAKTIFVGEVISQRAVMDNSSQGRSIHTIVTFRVEDVWKGSLGVVTQLEFLGGTVDDLTMDVAGMPQFSVGQRSVLFVGSTVRSASPLVGFMHGRFRIERDLQSGVDRVRTFDGQSLGSTASLGIQRTPSLTSVTAMRLTDFATAVRTRVSSSGKR